MNTSLALAMCALILLVSFLLSRVIRRVRRRAGARNIPGALITGFGTAILGYAVIVFFQLHGPLTLAVVLCAIAGFWSLIAQALVGEREDPAHPNRFFR
jgi:drug/metabolite transporter (DMT)-like permease